MTRRSPNPPTPPTPMVRPGLPPHDAVQRMEAGRAAAAAAITETIRSGDPKAVEDMMASTLDACPWWASGVIQATAQHLAALGQRGKLRLVEGGRRG
ncbi:hypothetical protein [Roseomonas sp. WA12]